MNAGEVFNTPGYYYFIGYWIAGTAIALNYKKEADLWKQVSSYIAAFSFLAFFMTLTDGVRQILFLPAMMVIICILFLFIHGSCGFNGKESGFFCVKAFISGEFSASLCWQIYYFFAKNFSGKGLVLWRWAEIIVVYGLMFIGFFLLERYMKTGLEELQITVRELLVAILIAVAVFGVSNMSYVDRNGLFSGRFAMDIFIIRTVVDLSGMAMLYAYHTQVKELQLRFEMDTLQNIMDTQYKNYQISKESMDLVNQKYHDLKHQIVLLKAENATERSLRHLEKMEQEIKIYEAQNKTGNKILDAVLTSKSMYCQKHGIELKTVVDGELLSFMDDMDVSALFGNMLDNAMESVEKLKDTQKRLISFQVSREKSFLCISMSNYCEEKIKFKNGLPITTKKDKRIHGYGMKSIRTTVEKYGGSAVADLKDNWFGVKIVIPLKERAGAA